jgi:hypothetical protein
MDGLRFSSVPGPQRLDELLPSQYYNRFSPHQPARLRERHRRLQRNATASFATDRMPGEN